MTKEELKQHCEKQVKACEMWAKNRGQEPSGKVYEEHKLILDLIKALEQEGYYKDLAQSYERTIAKLTQAIAEQQPSEDCVSREQTLLALTGENLSAKSAEELIALFNERIKALPPVTPTRKQGKWDKGYGFPDGAYWKCSCCNELIKVRYPMNYCPNCGADMRGREE